MTKKLYRSQTDKIIAGVAGGLGQFFELDASLLRLVFILTTMLGGSGLVVYLVLWLVLPQEDQLEVGSQEVIKKNVKEMEAKARAAVKTIKEQAKKKSGQQQKEPVVESVIKESRSGKYWLGIGLIIFGLIFFLENLGLFNFAQFWPLVLVLLGLMVAFRS